MKIAFNPSTVAALTTPPNNKDITFDLRGHSIFARGVEFKGTDTNTWRDIKINNVSIGSYTLDLRNGSNTTLTNTNGVVTINSTWRPVVDNLTSDSTTSSLSAKQGEVLKALIDGKSNSDHNHDGRYVRAFGTSNDNIDSDWGQSFKTFDPIPLGTPPENNSNISLLSIGENFNRRKQLAFIWNNDNIYYRRHVNSDFTNWRRLAFANEIPTSLKNPYALTISLNGTSQGPYDGSAAKNINITPNSIGAAVSNHSHDYLVVNSADDKSFNSAYHNFQVLYADGGNGITGKPANVDAFGLFKFRAASGWSGQMLLANGGSLYIRSSEDAQMTNTLAWKTILDSSNYSGILDSRYYTESEVNSLLSRKLDRVNLTTGSWNPRGYNFVADYQYNGGDLSISESGGRIHVSIDGYFWQNEGKYKVLDSSNYTEFINNYYWANVKISASSSTTTSPTVHTLTATRVCAGHNPEEDNSISCSNWFRSSGNSGWYNSTYRGGWYMSDTSWIRAYNGVGVYTSGQIYSSSSIRMGNICLERTKEINSSEDLLINYKSSCHVALCLGGGYVGIGTKFPNQKLDVRGNFITTGFGIKPHYLSSLSLSTVRLNDGFTYKCLEIQEAAKISCIMADRVQLTSERGVLIKFNKGYDGQILILRDLQNYGSGDGFLWVMPSGCAIVKGGTGNILIGSNQISNAYSGNHSRFLVYSSVYNVWIEFFCM